MRAQLPRPRTVASRARAHSTVPVAVRRPRPGLSRRKRAEGERDESWRERLHPRDREQSVERECDSRDRSRNPRDRERAQRRPSRESRPREGNKREEREHERSLVDPPISRERDRRSCPAEIEEATREGSASTGDSCEHDDPATPTQGRDEAAESLVPAEAKALAAPPPPPPLPLNGWRGERSPHENPRGGHPPSSLNGHAPQKEGGVTEGEGEAQGVRLQKKPRWRAVGSEAQREGHFLWRSL